MTRFSKTLLMMGFSLIALNACSSDKGPGPIGSKDDIVVRNNGIPGAVQDVAAAAPAGEVIEGVSPAVESAAQAMEAENAPLGSTAATPTGDVTVATTESAVESLPVDSVAPQDRVRDQSVAVPTEAELAPVAQPETSVPAPVAESVPAAAPVSSVYPSSDYPAAAAAAPVAEPAPAAPVPVASEPEPAVAPAPVPSSAPVHHSSYPLDPNAPYSPKAMAGATAAVPAAAAPSAQGAIRSASDNIIAAKSALKAKGLYSGKEDGTMDAAFLNALTLYQGVNNLPQGGLNAETLAHMGAAQ